MCILFMYDGSKDAASDYSLILATNRDEFYHRPTQNFGSWIEDPHVIGGRDLEANGTWLAISPFRRKFGVLLNLPGTPKPDAQSRGKLVANYVRSDTSIRPYIDGMKNYVRGCNEFLFIAVELKSNLTPLIHTYNNETDVFATQTDPYLGFGNSLPEIPLKKVEEGKRQFKEICERLNKAFLKRDLVNELISLLKSEERHLPDPELEKRRPLQSQQLSSIFVCIPEGGYGTRTHTLILVTKSGQTDVIEISLQSPIDIKNPKWHTTEFQFNVKNNL